MGNRLNYILILIFILVSDAALADIEDFEYNIGYGSRQAIADSTVIHIFSLYGWRYFYQSGTVALYPDERDITTNSVTTNTKIEVSNGSNIALQSLTIELDTGIDGNVCQNAETVYFYGYENGSQKYSDSIALSNRVLTSFNFDNWIIDEIRFASQCNMFTVDNLTYQTDTTAPSVRTLPAAKQSHCSVGSWILFSH